MGPASATKNETASPGDHREVRKVQFTGRSTYVLSLPKNWIEEMHVMEGFIQ